MKLKMFGSGFLTLFGVSLFFQCDGRITSPPDGKILTLLNGSTANITWSFDNDLSAVNLRVWKFTSSDGVFNDDRLGRIIDNDPPSKITRLLDVAIERPGTLLLKNVNQTYDGTYKFSIETETSAVVVYIAKKPNVTLDCRNCPVRPDEGDNFTCLCKSKGGNPPPNVTWYKDGVKISDVGTVNQTLNIWNINRKDTGTYKCVATSYPNINYTDEKSCQVIVNFKPTNTEIKFSQNPAVVNQTVKITCAFEGQPKATYIIYYNDTKVVSTNMPYFKNVTLEDAGTYKCIANNTLGNDSDSKILNVTDKPIRTTPPTLFQSTYTQAIQPSSTVQRTVPSNSVTPAEPGESGPNIPLIIGLVLGGVALIAICGVVYCKFKGNEREDKKRLRGNADVNPNGSRVITNQYELEEDHGEDAGAYDTVKQSDDGEGLQDRKKPAGDSLPPVYASVNKDNRQGNTLYASLDSEELRKPGSRRKQPETKNAPTEYASIDFMQTGKTPNADNAETGDGKERS
ncbi:hemicentin-1-like [Dendronephthya gigantea]|uniref:hemicentin-1-like n=1 Tax=Dendronephthya gigantea TaxID=151771 RepID=UPI001069E7F6|nr:hemicentin-1-like [Dendronephthya gigantea]